MLSGSIDFTTPMGEDLCKFTHSGVPNQIYRASVLHYADDQNQLKPIIRAAFVHYHQTPEGVDGLKGFQCLSTPTEQAACCKNTLLFGEATVKAVAPILLYPTQMNGDLIPGAQPEMQILVMTKTSFGKLQQINKTYPLASNDFSIMGKKLQKGTQLDFIPVGAAAYQQNQETYAHWLAKAKEFVTGPKLSTLDRMVGKKVSALDVETAIRGGQPQLPQAPYAAPMPPAPPQAIPVPPLPALPAPVAAAPLPTGPASPAQMAAITGLTQ